MNGKAARQTVACGAAAQIAGSANAAGVTARVASSASGAVSAISAGTSRGQQSWIASVC
jgi:hypothetical protein